MILREIPNFLSKEECEYIISLIEKNNVRSAVAEAGNAYATSEQRTSSTSNLPTSDETVVKLHQKIADFIGLPIEKGEHLQGQKYQPGQFFKEHADYFTGPAYQQHCLSSGNRTHTLMLYLNDVESGGETSFPRLSMSIKPSQGTAVMWTNLKPDGTVETDSLHAGTEVFEGTKYIVTSWWRENTWNGAEDRRLGLEKETQIQMTPEKKTFSKWEELPKLTEKGYKVVDIPADAWEKIQQAYELVKEKKTEEKFNSKETIIPGNGNTSDIFSLEHVPELRKEIQTLLHPIHEEWSGETLIPSFVYGIRSYNRGATLVQHRDIVQTHHVSSILMVDKDLHCGCMNKDFGADWALDLQDHEGNWQKVYLEPGQMLLYESAVCSHGRNKPFEGLFYRNFYCHFTLADYEYVNP